MSTEAVACTLVTEFHYYPILSCLISNNSRCVDFTRTYLLLLRLSLTGRENREQSQSWLTASSQSSYLHDSQAIAQEQKLLKHHYINALTSVVYFSHILNRMTVNILLFKYLLLNDHLFIINNLRLMNLRTEMHPQNIIYLLIYANIKLVKSCCSGTVHKIIRIINHQNWE